MNQYLPGDTKWALSFMEIVFVTYCNSFKMATAVFEKIVILIFGTHSKGHSF
jgi:hypothetical protein